MRRISFVFLPILLGGAAFWFSSHTLSLEHDVNAQLIEINLEEHVEKPPEKPIDIEPQKPLANPPKDIKALYATTWSAASSKKLTYLIDLIKKSEANALVVDVKDYSGYVAYNTDLQLPYTYNAVEHRIPYLNKLIKRLHDEDIYVIARVAVFQDPRLALARPDLALMSSSTQKTWVDYKNIPWMDTASPDVWEYNLDIAEELINRGIDEVNFDYIRFASDGDLDDIIYPVWDETTYKTRIVEKFFKRMRERLPNAMLSADLFGLVTVNTDGLGIGQHLEFALPYFNAIAPMVYPSHYAKGFIGLDNPAEHPYAVIKYSMDTALRRITVYQKGASTTPVATLRPWIQDFDLGADYGEKEILGQIQAIYDSGTTTQRSDLISGWMIWNPSNIYTEGGF